MWKAIRCFFSHLRDYDAFLWWYRNLPEASQKEFAHEMPKNRLIYALRGAKVAYKSSDTYGRKCRKADGDCDKCTAKRCLLSRR